MDHSKFNWPDWRITTGFIISTVWIASGFYYLKSIVGFSAFVALPTGDIGSFLEGSFAPLAFMWLVIGHFMQQKEISANTKAIEVQEQNAERLELHSRRETYFKLLELVQDQLGVIVAFHYYSVEGHTGNRNMDIKTFTAERDRASNGDNALFVRRMILLCRQADFNIEALKEIFLGTEIRERHTTNYEKTFSKLLASAHDVDADEMISNSLLHGSAYGRLYVIIQYMRGKAEAPDIF